MTTEETKKASKTKKPLTKTENAVYVFLAHHATRKNRVACVSKKYIAQKLGITTNTVYRATKTLEEKGMIRIEARYAEEVNQQLSNRYIVLDRTHLANKKKTA